MLCWVVTGLFCHACVSAYDILVLAAAGYNRSCLRRGPKGMRVREDLEGARVLSQYGSSRVIMKHG